MKTNASKTRPEFDDLAAAAADYLIGRCGVDAFSRRTYGAFRTIALHAMRRWRCPPWLAVEDVTHDAMLAAVAALPGGLSDAQRASAAGRGLPHAYDAEIGKERGISLAEYVRFNAYSSAKRRIHVARLGRRPHAGEGSMPSRFELCEAGLSRVGPEGEDSETPLDRAGAEPTQEARVVRRQLFERIGRELGSQVLASAAFRALAETGGDSVECAALALYGDVGERNRLHLGSEDAAIRFVAAAIEMVLRS